MSSDEESDRPRRLEDGTMVYLLSIASKLDEAKKLGDDTLALEEQEIIVNNVFEEVKGRSASAACDKRTNSIIEQLLLMANLPVLLETMNKFTKYAKFLTLNRHSSHVLQSLFARTAQVLKSTGIPEELEGETVRTTMAIAQTILAPKTIDIAMRDMCGSHVVRSLISLLAGIPAIGEKKSKNAKHQHSHPLSVPLEVILEPDCYYVRRSAGFEVPAEFHECLMTELVTAHLLSKSATELHNYLTNTNSCAVITLLLRVLFNPELVPGGRDLATQLVYKILGAPEADENNQLGPMYEHMVSIAAGRQVDPVTGAALASSSDAAAAHQQTLMAWESCGEIVADMSENSIAAFFLEVVAECAPLELLCCVLYYTVLLNGTLTLVDFAASNNANYFVQACCRRLSSAMKLLATQQKQEGSEVAASVMLQLNTVRGLVFKIANDLFTTSAVTADNITTTSMNSAVYRVIIYRGGIVRWALEAVRWFDYCATLTAGGSNTNASAAAGLSSKVSLAVLQCWLCHHQHTVNSTSASLTGNVTLSALPSTSISPVSQGAVNQMIQHRLQPIAPAAGGDNAGAAAVGNKRKKKGKGRALPTETAATAGASAESSPVNSNTGTIANQILFAKQLEQLMNLSSSPVSGTSIACKSSKYIVTALSTLPEASLIAIAKQGQLCKPILDTFLTLIIKNTNTNTTTTATSSSGGGSSSRKGGNAVYTEDFRRFLNTLMGCALDLAVHPTGMHVLKQLFEQTNNFTVKEALVTLLHGNYEMLMSGSARNIAKILLLNVCKVDVFHKYGSEEWQRVITASNDGADAQADGFLESLDAQQKQFQQQQQQQSKSDSEKNTASKKKEVISEEATKKSTKRNREPEAEAEQEKAPSKEKKSKKEKKHKRSKLDENEDEE